MQVRNPYLDVFLKYMEFRSDIGLSGWTAKTEWKYSDGFDSPKWDRHCVDDTNAHRARDVLTERMAWAVPNTEAIEAIVNLRKPVVELGAGTGYWAWLLDQVGVDVTAFDKNLEGNNFHCGEHWFPVKYGTQATVCKDTWKGHALLLVWPPYRSDMPAQCLEKFPGDALVFVGEGECGCTANQEFFILLEQEAYGWTSSEEISIPQWEGMRDYMTIYRRPGD